MMPEMDGGEALRQVREMAGARGIRFPAGVKVIMTTAVDDIKEVMRSFNEIRDACLVKPINLSELLAQAKSYHLVQ